MILMELLASTPVYEITGPRIIDIAGITANPDDVKSDYMYIYIEEDDGLPYEYAIEKAVSKGASAICISQNQEVTEHPVTYVKTYHVKRFLSAVSRNFNHNPSQNMNLVGITGSHGKTTVGWMLKSILKYSGIKCVSMGMSGYQMSGEGYNEYRYGFHPITIHSSLKQAVDKGIRRGIIECSYTAIVDETLRHISFDSLIYTDLYTFFKNQLADYHYLEIRKNLIEYLKLTNSPIIVNIDDLYAGELVRNTTCSYGLFNSNDVTAMDIKLSPDSSAFTICAAGEKRSINLKAPGIYNVYNAMASTAWGISEGLHIDMIKKGLEEYIPETVSAQGEPLNGDIEIVFAQGNYNFYNNIETILKDLKNSIKGNIILVLVAGDEKQMSTYKELGRIASNYCTGIVITSDYNHPDQTVDIALAIAQGSNNTEISHEIDNFKALQKAVQACKDGDAVFIIKQHE